MTTSAGKKPFFSLVMPVYGVERYIADSIADMLTQTFVDFELIVVDDGTPDRSIDIVEELAAADPRVRIVRHDRNRGLSQARNTGIQAASGEWLSFPDPDDRYDANMLELAHDAIVSMPSDLVIFGHTQEYYGLDNEHLYDNPIDLESRRFQGDEEIARGALELERQTHLGYAWNKIYRTDIVRDAGLLFEDDVPLIEDILFNIAYLRHCESISTISSKPYHYAKRLKGNLTSVFIPNYYELHRRRIAEIRGFIDDCGMLDDEAKSTLGTLYARYILSSIEQNTNPKASMDVAQQKAWLKSLFDDKLFNELVPTARATDSKSLKVCLKILNSRNIPALLALGNCIHFVRNHGTTLYTKVKSGR